MNSSGTDVKGGNSNGTNSHLQCANSNKGSGALSAGLCTSGATVITNAHGEKGSGSIGVWQN